MLQQELFPPPKPKKPRGGKRRGAGRPPKGERAGSPHKKRPNLKARFPVHITLRVVNDMVNLRKRKMYAALREATITVARREHSYAAKNWFRIVHLSIQKLHVHLIVEAENAEALSRGMQAFQISAAKHMNRELSVGQPERRRGTVFPDRYHEEIIKTPTQARRTISYVLNNWRRHHEDRAPYTTAWKVDPFSSGLLFHGWKERENAILMWRWRETYKPMFVYLPNTWLLREGWKRRGEPLSFHETPGPRYRPTKRKASNRRTRA